MVKAVIFDMDGVLIDSELPKFRFLQNAFRKNGKQLDDSLFPKIIGKAAKHFLEEQLTDPKEIEMYANIFKEDYLANITQYVKPIPTTVSFIKQYAGKIKFAIVSNGFSSVNEIIAKYIGIYPYISIILSREQVKQMKPHSEIYLKSLKLLRMNSSDCIAIEDSMTGIESAIKASIPCYVFLNTYNHIENFKNIPVAGFIKSIDDLIRITS